MTCSVCDGACAFSSNSRACILHFSGQGRSPERGGGGGGQGPGPPMAQKNTNLPLLKSKKLVKNRT
jgi:hypothetical protein